MSRFPKPLRTKRGMGVGARLQLSIDYYRAPDGAGPDFGFLKGRDDYGTWELPFASREELDDVVAKVMLSLYDVATQAREESDERSADGRAVWLKAFGAQGSPIDEVWWKENDPDHLVDFPFRPKSIKVGDLLVLYAAGTGKLVGVARVTDRWFRADRYERWPWAIPAEILVAKTLSDGVPLDLLSGERVIGKSIRQKSHVRLSPDEAAKALAAFGLEQDA